eukprot:TRINITY_DN8694_c0_g8_i1.p1 TRINITY_DN8694_c0_g8~~TRINITY_DN8694_c0_g8_i1.p1  ORF type:complete len:170 (-),score=19.24 TRINITY_DN8694_c0_g8_i1:355-864(-)
MCIRDRYMGIEFGKFPFISLPLCGFMDTQTTEEMSPRPFPAGSSLTKRRRASRYAKIQDDDRKALIDLVIGSKMEVKEAAQKCGINHSTARAILKVYHEEGRVFKKKIRAKKKIEHILPKQPSMSNLGTANTFIPMISSQYLIQQSNPILLLATKPCRFGTNSNGILSC